MTKTVPVTGGCLCGAVRYEATAPPRWVGYCHCRQCQRAYGGLFGLFAAFDASTFRFILGAPRYFRSSRFAKRGFCAQCGTPIDYWYEGSAEPGILIGTLDHPEDWPPTRGHNGVESQVSWHVIADGLPRWETTDSPLLKEARAQVGEDPDEA